MTPSPQLQLRATDADRNRVVQMLRVAAEEGALTVDELEERLSAGLAAVTRADLVRLVDDLPPSPATRSAPAPAPSHPVRTSSRYWLWVLLPYLSAASWVHAALLTRSPRYWLLAAVYSIPLALAVIVAPGVNDEIPGWLSAVVLVFWIVNAILAWTARPVVDAAWARARTAARST
jgi:apolipoprotein N-acyltransferase